MYKILKLNTVDWSTAGLYAVLMFFYVRVFSERYGIWRCCEPPERSADSRGGIVAHRESWRRRSTRGPRAPDSSCWTRSRATVTAWTRRCWSRRRMGLSRSARTGTYMNTSWINALSTLSWLINSAVYFLRTVTLHVYTLTKSTMAVPR